jgi:hypothetical protein
MRVAHPLLVFSILGFLSLASVAQDKKEPAKEAVTKVTAAQISKEFWDSEVAAIKKYKGKTLEVDGKVAEPLKRVFGDNIYHISLTGQRPTARVAFNFDKKAQKAEFDIADKLKLTAGQSVKIRGLCDGGSQDGPLIKDCSVIEPKEPK